MRPETLKLLEENIGQTLQGKSIGNDFQIVLQKLRK
jgi:hypothetical protein